MRTTGIHTRVASFVGAVALVIQISPARATDQDQDHNSRPVDISFTKWGWPHLLCPRRSPRLASSKVSLTAVQSARTSGRCSGDNRA